MKIISGKKIKIAIAMSGGVDSSVSAWLLKKQGHEVHGFFMRFWSDPTCEPKRENSCCDSQSLKKAKEVAKKLDIPLHIVDVNKLFKKLIVDSFIDEYKNLKTPNPCILCNEFIKFGWLLDFARKLGFEKIATGHYARIKKDRANFFHLYSGKDKNKDQSYFLHGLNQKQLEKIIFPVGNMAKKEVLKIARAKNLKFENRKESQEICFIRDKDYREFLKRHLPKKYFEPGEIINLENKPLGRHNGLVNYTIGQRRGIEQSENKNENKKPLYVVGFKKRENKLIAGSEKDIYNRKMRLKNATWISKIAEKKALDDKALSVKIRYRHVQAACSIGKEKTSLKVIFKKPQRAVTPGQYAVFYLKDEVLGGGIIT